MSNSTNSTRSLTSSCWTFGYVSEYNDLTLGQRVMTTAMLVGSISSLLLLTPVLIYPNFFLVNNVGRAALMPCTLALAAVMIGGIGIGVALDIREEYLLHRDDQTIARVRDEVKSACDANL
jgi:hypothetical protein